MTKNYWFIFFFIPVCVFAQTDYGASWKDFYSYNNVKDVVITDEEVFALVDNAIFTYDLSTNQVEKVSSVNGLSGETTSAIFFHESSKRLVIGYETGLIEVLKEDKSIHISADIVNFNQSGEKGIHHISERGNTLYISTPFAIVAYDIDKLEFGDTYFIGAASSAVKINQTLIMNDAIYAATERGVYKADLSNPNLVDANNWELIVEGNFSNLTHFDGAIYIATQNRIYKLNETDVVLEKTLPSVVLSLKSESDYVTVTTEKTAYVYTKSWTEVFKSATTLEYNYNLNSALVHNNKVFLNTKEYGILQTPLTVQNFTEIHPKGPLSNSVFSVASLRNNFWFVYGGYNAAYVPTGNRKGFSHFNGLDWINTSFTSAFPVVGLVHVTIDPSHENRVFISSFADTNSGNVVSGGGLLEVVDDEILQMYHSQNSPLEDYFPNNSTRITTRINGTVFDRQGNLWITDALGAFKLKKLSIDGSWKTIDLRSLQTNSAEEVNTVQIDKSNSLWIGTRRNGVYVYSESGDQKRALTTEPTEGSLPHANVRTLAIDANNRVWLGTQSGLVVFNNASGLFDASIYDAQPVIILDDGIPKKLLGNQTVNTIAVDGADNKWFGTDNGGVLYTNPNGQKTLASFNKDNSPLPSNKILKISVDTSTGIVLFATDKGVVAYDSKVAGFGTELAAVYAYPNPALRSHQIITIDGKNGEHLPKGTNVKILDVSGNLVYETNVVEGQQLQGGKVVWNKTNLAGKQVASGVYIVLLTNDDATETSTTKIAIIN